MSDWTFVTNHSLVLSYINRNSRTTALGIAQAVGITERTAHKIIADLEQSGYITRKKVGRQNRYLINPGLSIRQPGHEEVAVGELLKVLGWKRTGTAKEQMRLL
jgi:DNA-binding Lrp family transcriptional regulator